MDELDKLRAALRDTPAPDAEAKAAALRMADENFANFQETAAPARPIETSPIQGGFLKGLTKMFAKSNSTPLMLTTSSIVVVGVGLLVINPLSRPDAVVAPEAIEIAAERGDDLEVAEPAPAVPPLARPTAETASDPTSQGGVRLSGPAELAIQEESPLEGQFFTDIDITYTETGETDTGLTFGETVSTDMPSRSPRAKSSQAEPRTFISGNFGAVTMGDKDDALEMLDLLPQPQIAQSDDRFASAATNPVKLASEEPVSTFSIDVDTASYAWVRSTLKAGLRLNPDAVRVEEMVNYFPYAYPAPTGDVPFETTVSLSETPWNPDTQLMHIAVQGAQIDTRPPLNATIENALTRLSAGGSTAGGAGLRAAYDLAQSMTQEGDVSRVILATDGDFNVGLQSDAEMKGFVSEQRNSGTYLSVLGFGRGNLNDALMQTLAQNGKRFGSAAPGGNDSDLAFLRLRYKTPGNDTSQLLEQVIEVGTSEPSREAQFATAIAGFGQILRGTPALGDWSYADAIALASGAKGDDPYGYRTEAVQLMRLAQSLSQR